MTMLVMKGSRAIEARHHFLATADEEIGAAWERLDHEQRPDLVRDADFC